MRSLVHKMCLLALILLAFSGSTQAQVDFQKEVEFDYFEYVKTTDKIMYTCSPVDKTFDQSELVIFNLEGEELNRINLQSKRRPTISQVQTMGDNSVFYLSTGEFLIVDASGKESGRKSITTTDNVKNSQIVMTETGVTWVMQVKVKKVGVGIRVIQYNTEFEELWKFEKMPEKGKYNFDMATANKSGEVAVLYKKGYDYGLCLLDAKGEEKKFEMLSLEKNFAAAYRFEYNSDGNIMLVADVGSTSSETFKGIPVGMTVAIFDAASGTVKSEKYLNFVELQAQVGDKKGDGSPVYSTVAPALHLLDIVTVNGKAYYLCESYLSKERIFVKPAATPGGATTNIPYRQMTLMDYYLLDVADITKDPVRIWKQTRTIEIELGSFGTAYGARQRMLNNGLFSYQGMVGDKILSRGYGQMHNYYTLINPSDGRERLDKRTYWGDPISDEVSLMPQRIIYPIYSGTFPADYISDEGIVKTGSSYTLYQYDSYSNQLKLSKLTL